MERLRPDIEGILAEVQEVGPSSSLLFFFSSFLLFFFSSFLLFFSPREDERWDAKGQTRSLADI
jgi:hypothetical protein